MESPIGSVPDWPLVYLNSARGHQHVHQGVDHLQAPDGDGHVDKMQHRKQRVQEGRPQASRPQDQGEEDGESDETSTGVPDDEDAAVAEALSKQLAVFHSGGTREESHVTEMSDRCCFHNRNRS
ncbi:hypothetical protein BgiBS90_034149 [Biomphalaria glabrata]|nr:hypothetical protein BgiBS90_034149 [Biomphalaria glabrata]